jgi:hypothetical protein
MCFVFKMQGQQGYPALSNSLTPSSQAANKCWTVHDGQARLSVQQQQNPMLNAQLTVSIIRHAWFVELFVCR